MKINIINIVLGVSFTALLLTACTDGNDWSTDPSKERLFSVSSNEISITRYMDKLGFIFKAVKGAESYEMELSRDTLTDEKDVNANGTSIVRNLTPDEIKDTIWITNLKKDTRYYFRVRNIAPGKNPSKWSYYKDSKNRYYAKTKAEQLFSTAKSFAQTVIKPTDLFQDSLRLRWKKDDGSETAAVDHVVISQGSQQIASISFNDDQKSKRICVIKYSDYGMTANTSYNFKLYNGDDKRGELNVTTPKALPTGIHILDTDAGETIEGLVTGGTGDVVIGIPPTAENEEDPETDKITINKFLIPTAVNSVTFYGLPGGLPRYLDFAGSITFEGNLSKIRFENIQVASNNEKSIIDQTGITTENGTSIDIVEFENVTMPILKKSAIVRLRNSSGATIKTLSLNNVYVMEQNGIQFIYTKDAKNAIENIVIKNSTFSNMNHSFIDVSEKANGNTVSISDVTFYKIIGSGRYFVNNKQLTPAPVVEVSRSIFAKSNASAVRCIQSTVEDNAAAYNFSTCYMTSDFKFEEKEGKLQFPFYVGSSVSASTKIMKDPKNGNFTITDNTVEGGDPRWIQLEED